MDDPPRICWLEVIRLASRRDSAFAQKFTEQYVEEKRRELQEQAAQNQPVTTVTLGKKM